MTSKEAGLLLLERLDEMEERGESIEIREALRLGVIALRRRTPEEVKPGKSKNRGFCPYCSAKIEKYTHCAIVNRHCRWCGQALDWTRADKCRKDGNAVGYTAAAAADQNGTELRITFHTGEPGKGGVYLALVTEADLFNGGEMPPSYMVIEWSDAWNVKAAVRVLAWAELPEAKDIKRLLDGAEG